MPTRTAWRREEAINITGWGAMGSPGSPKLVSFPSFPFPSEGGSVGAYSL